MSIEEVVETMTPDASQSSRQIPSSVQGNEVLARGIQKSQNPWSARNQLHPPAIRPHLRPTLSLESVTLGIANPLIPPANFGVVSEGEIYRSDFPNAANFKFLQSLKLKTILTLVEGPFPTDYSEFIAKDGIRHVNVVLPANKAVVRMEHRDVLRALSVVFDQSNYPLLIHCNKGKHRTGCVVACYRRLNGHALPDAIAEYKVFASTKARPLDEKFIGDFDVNVKDLLAMVQMEENEPRSESPLLRSASVPPARLRS